MSATVHHVFANRRNAGDWTSARGIQSLLAPLAIEERLCDDPFVPETLQRLAAAPPGDLLLVGGGGLFMDYFEPFWRGLEEVAGHLTWCLWGVGFCDGKAAPTRPAAGLLARIVARSRLCVVRDALSRDLLPVRAAVETVPCPSLAAIDARAPGFGVLHVNNHRLVGEEGYARMRSCAQELAARTGRPFRETNNRLADPVGLRRLAELHALYEASDLVLSSALHGCIFAVALGRPVLAVSGDRKIEAFMEAAGLAEWVLEPGALPSLPERLAALPAQPRVPAFVARARRENAAVAERVRALAEGAT